MRTTIRLVFGFLLLGLIAASSLGQKKKERDFRGVCWLLFYDKGIADELKLTPKDMEKAKKAAIEVTDRYQDKLDKARVRSKDAPEHWTEVVTEAARETDKALAKVLKPAQMKRLEQIHRQAYFYQYLLDKKSTDLLKFTPEQKKKLSELAGEGGPGMSQQEKKEWVDKGLAVLTPEQKKAWETLVGPRYKFRTKEK
jgi:hypothetical protein